jgi:hypothetical protein
MKTIYNVVLAGILLALQIQVFAQECEKEISTNPLAPYNNHPFPQGRYNPWLNSDFNIGELENGNVPPMPLNNQIGWQISDFVFGNAFDMWNPYTSAGTPGTRYLYLHPTGLDFEDLDWKWEDGWEVLHIGLGFYPNGEPIQTSDALRAYSSGVNAPSNTRVPYIILYNRYRGTLRVFMNLFTSFGGYSDIHIVLEFEDAVSGLSGILRNLEPFDQSLDQATNVKRHESFNPNSGGSSRWFSADFQMGYDPCICGKNQKWKITLWGIESFDVQLDGRGVTVEMPISDGNGNPNYDIDWLSSNGLQDGLAGGNQIFTKMEGLVEDYKNALDKYEQDSEAYADYLEKKAVLDAWEGFIVDGALGFIPAGGSLKSWFLKPKEGEPGNFASYIKGASKGLLGYGYDQLSMGINPKTGAPKAPDMPTASYSEMRFDGTIDGTSQAETIGPFFIPGSYDESSSLSNLDAFNYPAYNAPVGLFAILRKPKPLVFFNSSISSISPFSFNNIATPLLQFRLRFDEAPIIAYNPSLDFNWDQTECYVSVEVDLSRSRILDIYNETDSVAPVDGIFTNMSVTYFKHNTNSDEIRVNSKWVPLSELNQMVYSFLVFEEVPNGLTSEDENSPFFQGRLNYDLKSLKIKFAFDSYFDQVGGDGQQTNTFTVFTHEVHNLNEPLSDIMLDFGEIPQGTFNGYAPGVVTLGNETITSSHPNVQTVVGNEIFINAQEVHITGPLEVEEGYTLVIQALEQIHQQLGAVFNPKIHMRIKKDFYNTPVFEYAANAAVQNFCNNSNDYQANTASKALRARLDKEVEANENADHMEVSGESFNKIFLLPNPARDLLTLRSSHLDMTAITIHDLSGRPIKQETLQAHSRETQINLSGIAPGTYIVRVDCGDEVLSEKLVVTK